MGCSCVICWELLYTEDGSVEKHPYSMACGHIFHKSCLEKHKHHQDHLHLNNPARRGWENLSCPTCRATPMEASQEDGWSAWVHRLYMPDDEEKIGGVSISRVQRTAALAETTEKLGKAVNMLDTNLGSKRRDLIASLTDPKIKGHLEATRGEVKKLCEDLVEMSREIADTALLDAVSTLSRFLGNFLTKVDLCTKIDDLETANRDQSEQEHLVIKQALLEQEHKLRKNHHVALQEEVRRSSHLRLQLDTMKERNEEVQLGLRKEMTTIKTAMLARLDKANADLQAAVHAKLSAQGELQDRDKELEKMRKDLQAKDRILSEARQSLNGANAKATKYKSERDALRGTVQTLEAKQQRSDELSARETRYRQDNADIRSSVSRPNAFASSSTHRFLDELDSPSSSRRGRERSYSDSEGDSDSPLRKRNRMTTDVGDESLAVHMPDFDESVRLGGNALHATYRTITRPGEKSAKRRESVGSVVVDGEAEGEWDWNKGARVTASSTDNQPAVLLAGRNPFKALPKSRELQIQNSRSSQLVTGCEGSRPEKERKIVDLTRAKFISKPPPAKSVTRQTSVTSFFEPPPQAVTMSVVGLKSGPRNVPATMRLPKGRAIEKTLSSGPRVRKKAL